MTAKAPETREATCDRCQKLRMIYKGEDGNWRCAICGAIWT